MHTLKKTFWENLSNFKMKFNTITNKGKGGENLANDDQIKNEELLSNRFS